MTFGGPPKGGPDPTDPPPGSAPAYIEICTMYSPSSTGECRYKAGVVRGAVREVRGNRYLGSGRCSLGLGSGLQADQSDS